MHYYLQFLLQFPQVDVGRSYLCTEGYLYGDVLFTAGLECFPLRLYPLPDASEYIQFPTGIERRIIIMCDGLGQFGGVTTALLAEPSTI